MHRKTKVGIVNVMIKDDVYTKDGGFMNIANINITDNIENRIIGENGKAAAKGENGAATETATGVTMDISEQAKKLFQDNEKRSYMEQLEAAQESGETARESMDDLAKILEIARRISRGDKVPASDERKLIEYSSDIYQAAKAAAAMNEKKAHKKYKSLYEDEDKTFEDKLRELNKKSDEGCDTSVVQIAEPTNNESGTPAGDSGELEA